MEEQVTVKAVEVEEDSAVVVEDEVMIAVDEAVEAGEAVTQARRLMEHRMPNLASRSQPRPLPLPLPHPGTVEKLSLQIRLLFCGEQGHLRARFFRHRKVCALWTAP